MTDYKKLRKDVKLEAKIRKALKIAKSNTCQQALIEANIRAEQAAKDLKQARNSVRFCIKL